MLHPGTLRVTTPSEREIAMTRVFAAPRRLVFDAYTKPELLKRWLGVFGGWELAICEIDLRVGGSFRYVWRGNGREMAMRGVYHEISAPERLVSSEKFEDPWYPGEAVSTLVLSEHAGQTTLVNTIRYDNRASRDAVLKSPMEKGVSAGYDQLDLVLKELAGGPL